VFTYHGYMLYEAERSKSAAELRSEDARRGEVAALLRRSWAGWTSALGRPLSRAASLRTRDRRDLGVEPVSHSARARCAVKA
jgi:hypothetical protein